jgi:hypothetical protein
MGTTGVDNKLDLAGSLQPIRLYRNCVILVGSIANKRPPLLGHQIAMAGDHRATANSFC